MPWAVVANRLPASIQASNFCPAKAGIQLFLTLSYVQEPLHTALAPYLDGRLLLMIIFIFQFLVYQ
jgi:hypothetical protein